MKKQIRALLNRYTYRAEWSDEDEAYIAHALELPSVKAHADSPEEAIAEVKKPLESALEMLLEDGRPLPDPIATHKYAGKVLVRTTPEIHKELAMRAAESGVSINQYILSRLT